MKSRVLIIHKEPRFCFEIQAALSEATIFVDTASSPHEAVELFRRYDYSLILLDIATAGEDIIKPLRAISSVPILALCVQNCSKERCTMLRAGVSACLTKPIDIQECAAQVEALLDIYFATNKKSAYRTIAYGTKFVIDPEFRTVF